jgi:hypothetical protein
MAVSYTNRKSGVPQGPTRKQASPYISDSGARILTAKEKEVRRRKTANYGMTGMGGAGAGNTTMSGQGNFFSVQMSTDFLELPQSLREKREIYRHFYKSDEIVAQALDLHTELPLSKVRLSTPKPHSCPEGFKTPHDYGRYILSRFQRMCDDVKLFQKLITIVHHIWLDGTAVVWCEDSDVEIPPEVGYEHKVLKQAVLDPQSGPTEVKQEVWVPKANRIAAEAQHYRKNYRGWSRLVVLPMDRVKVDSFDFTEKIKVQLIPSDRDRQLVQQAQQGDDVAAELVADMPAEYLEHMEQGGMIPLGTDPHEGSFVSLVTLKKAADQALGDSILDRCLRTLQFREKLRQAQTSIASRAMTPKRIVWAEGLSDQQTDMLREQVDLALVDPDYSIVANYEIHWEEMGSRDRLLDLQSEYEQTQRLLMTGLGVTESLMSGESLYSGDRLKLGVINQRYLHLREIIQDYVEKQLFEPVARRMGFVEKDEWGQEVVLYPKLQFNRLPLQDSQDMFDALFNLYQKGSVDVGTILELLNLDPDDTRTRIERDMFTVNDPLFNEVLRGIYSEAGRVMTEKSSIVEKLVAYLKLEMKPEPKEEESGSRF